MNGPRPSPGLRFCLLLGASVSLFGGAAAEAQTGLRCGAFTQDVLAAPEPRENGHARARFEQINAAIKSQPHRVLFLGDSLTERFATTDAPQVWQQHMAPRGVLDAGINGDRTEHLLWRLQHGHLDGPAPAGAVVLIGTNDLGHGRSVEDAAEGIRANLAYLRQRLPTTRILLLGLWPRGAAPDGKLRRETVAVNQLIRNCGDNGAITYGDIGGVLLDPQGRLEKAISPDLLHFSAAGYARLAPQLDSLIDRLLAGR